MRLDPGQLSDTDRHAIESPLAPINHRHGNRPDGVIKESIVAPDINGIPSKRPLTAKDAFVSSSSDGVREIKEQPHIPAPD